ncbi:transposable element Tcb1 transposase [Trichonephila clavipes]|nr:transposable element Tcb1 transposase [Trichonephila clavipes]
MEGVVKSLHCCATKHTVRNEQYVVGHCHGAIGSHFEEWTLPFNVLHHCSQDIRVVRVVYGSTGLDEVVKQESASNLYDYVINESKQHRFEIETSSVENEPRPGGPSKLTSRAKRIIVRSATNKPMTSAQNIANELLSSCNVSVSAQTVRNVLHSAGLKARTPRKKPYISEVNRKRRLEFAVKHKNKPMDFWKKVIFSDESKFEAFTPPSIRKI